MVLSEISKAIVIAIVDTKPMSLLLFYQFLTPFLKRERESCVRFSVCERTLTEAKPFSSIEYANIE